MPIFFRTERQLYECVKEFCDEKKAKPPKNIDKKFLGIKKNCWQLNLHGKMNADFRIFIRSHLKKWSYWVLGMGDRWAFDCCNHAILAKKAFLEKYPEIKVYSGDPFYLSKIGKWVVEIPEDKDRDKFNKFIEEEYTYPCPPTDLKLINL